MTKWKQLSNPKINTRRSVPEALIYEDAFVVLNMGQPTYQPQNGGISHLGITMTSRLLGVVLECNWSVLNSHFDSDHLPVLTSIDERFEQDGILVPKLKFDKADWAAFREMCREHTAIPLTIADDIDLYNENLSSGIRQSAEATVPETKPKRMTKHILL